MNETACRYTGNREETLVAYLYDEISPTERRAFESHLVGCEACRDELSEFGAVRARLGAWAPPEPSRALTASTLPSGSGRKGVLAALNEIPMWMQAAAAMLFLGLSAGAANLRIGYTTDGLSVQTGWLSPVITAQSASPVTLPVAASSIDAISKNEFSTEVRELRAEIGAAREADAALVRQLRTLIAESERKQQNELALRSAVLLQDVQSQRFADLRRIDGRLRDFGLAAETEFKRQEQRTNTISTQLLRVSTQK